MRNIHLLATLIIATPVVAQTTPASTPVAAVPATEALTVESPIAAIMADPAGKASIAKNLPDLPIHPMYESIKGMSLKEVQPMSSGAITDAMIANVDKDLKAAATKK